MMNFWALESKTVVPTVFGVLIWIGGGGGGGGGGRRGGAVNVKTEMGWGSGWG